MKFKKRVHIIQDLKEIFPNTKIAALLYNGTDTNYKSVDFSKVNLHDDGYIGKGFYVTSDPAYADEYGPIIKECYVDIRNPFSFNDMPDDIAKQFASVIVKYCSESILRKDADNFLYWLKIRSKNDELISLYNKIDKRKATNEDLKKALYTILTNPDYIIDGALMDFADVVTAYIKYKGHDGAYIHAYGFKYYEVVVYTPEQVYLIK